VVAGGVFINYRGEDSHSYGAFAVHRADPALQRWTGLVFLRVDPARRGLPRAPAGPGPGCGALLAVIGPRWLSTADAAGRRRIEDPQAGRSQPCSLGPPTPHRLGARLNHVGFCHARLGDHTDCCGRPRRRCPRESLGEAGDHCP